MGWLGLALVGAGLLMLGLSARPWGYTRAAWRGRLTAQEIMRWDGLAVSRGKRRLSRLGVLALLLGAAVLLGDVLR